MKSYYDVLGIPKTAGAQDIKRAYFGLVKRFPPERFPEEFKEIRAAYDTLSDEKKRAEYDSRGGLPEEAALLLDKAGECARLGRHKQASETLVSALKTYPEYAAVKEALARSLELEGKTGGATKLWEELCVQEPGNAEYPFKLALCYDRRGWNKKACERFERAVTLDGGNERYWGSYIAFLRDGRGQHGVAALCRRALEAVRERGTESALLYAYGVDNCIEEDAEAARGYLGDMGRVMRSRAADSKDEAAVDIALDGVMRSGNVRLFPLVRELAGMLPRIGEKLRESLEQAQLMYDIDVLEDNGFSDLLHDVFASVFNGCTCEECRHEMMAMEFHILEDLAAYRPQLNRLKKDYPRLYKLHAAFFDEALRTREPERLMEKRAKALVKYGRKHWEDGGDGPAPFQQTVRRESPKVGRNDPCPCGSGKKYKRCCGANA